MTNDIADVCSAHLDQEERLLKAAQPIVDAVQEAFARREPHAPADFTDRHQDFNLLIDDIHARRRRLRDELARRLNVPVKAVTLTRVVEGVAGERGRALSAQLVRVRRMANDLVATNHRLSIHLHIYLDAYQRLLRDLTGTASGSGRYGPQGRTDAPEYRPLLQING